MITITDLASSKIKEVLEQNDRQASLLRVYVRGMACSGPAFGMALDNEPRPDDAVHDLGELRVVVDPASAPYLEGAEIDYVDSLMGQGFQITNPTLVRQGGGGGCGGGCSCGR
jgi:iron-sulfur cluster assembly protein